MFMNKKSALAVSIALLATVSTGTATAKRLKVFKSAVDYLCRYTQWCDAITGSPQVFPNEYVSVNYSGSFRYSGGAFKTYVKRICNYYPQLPSNAADECKYPWAFYSDCKGAMGAKTLL